MSFRPVCFFFFLRRHQCIRLVCYYKKQPPRDLYQRWGGGRVRPFMLVFFSREKTRHDPRETVHPPPRVLPLRAMDRGKRAHVLGVVVVVFSRISSSQNI